MLKPKWRNRNRNSLLRSFNRVLPSISSVHLLLIWVALSFRTLIEHVVVGRIGSGSRLPRRELFELVNGGPGVLDEPVDGLAGAVVAEAVLHVVELDGGVGGEADPPVSWPLRRAHLAVPVLPSRRPDNVAALNLHDLSSPTAPHGHPRRRRRLLLVVELVLLLVAIMVLVVTLPHPLCELCMFGWCRWGRKVRSFLGCLLVSVMGFYSLLFLPMK